MGRIGNVLLKELNKRGDKVKVLIRKSSNLKSIQGCNCEYVYGDILDKQSLYDAITDDVEAVFHLAAYINISNSNKDKTYEINIKGTKNIVDICLERNIKLVYTSSIHAFDALEDDTVITENTKLSINEEKSRGLYDYSKAMAAKYIKDNVYINGLQAIVLHPTGVTGPYDYRPSLFGKGMIQLLKSNVKLTIGGMYDYVDVRDVVYGILKAYDLKKFGERYILSGEKMSMEVYSEILKRAAEIKSSTKIIGYKLALFISYVSTILSKDSQITPYSVKTLHSNCNISHNKATLELEYHPRSMKESITDQVNWFKSNGYLWVNSQSALLFLQSPLKFGVLF